MSEENGADRFIENLVASGLEVCFANPGTTEMPLVASLDRVSGMRSVLGLFEGVCTGAADGYGRMTGKPALTLLHLGPGFANGIANLHNARRARSPIINVIGDQATWHLHADAPLTSDILSLARPVSAWVESAESADELGRLAAESYAAATARPNAIATVIAPVDTQWEPCGPSEVESTGQGAPELDLDPHLKAAQLALAAGEAAVLYLGAPALRDVGIHAALRISQATGCRIFTETFAGRLEAGAHLPDLPRLPYFPEQGIEALASTAQLLCIGAPQPVAFFSYPDVPSFIAPAGCQVEEWPLEVDPLAGLVALADLVAPGTKLRHEAPAAPELPGDGEIDPMSLGRALAALQPEGAILVDEAATSALPHALLSGAAAPHTRLGLTGGAIGQGMPCATGAAIACPDRKVISFQADGSGMYTLQSLWTQAREKLDVVTVICANQKYRILQVELGRAGILEPGPTANALTDLRDPELDWVSLARGLGVSGVRVETNAALVVALREAFAQPGPHLIEVLL